MPTGRAPEVLVERFGNLLLPLGGVHGYVGVRGKQGKNRDKFQGYTPKKTHFTGLHDFAQEAAVARANLKKDLDGGIDAAPERKPRAKRGSLVGARRSSSRNDMPWPLLTARFMRVLQETQTRRTSSNGRRRRRSPTPGRRLCRRCLRSTTLSVIPRPLRRQRCRWRCPSSQRAAACGRSRRQRGSKPSRIRRYACVRSVAHRRTRSRARCSWRAVGGQIAAGAACA